MSENFGGVETYCRIRNWTTDGTFPGIGMIFGGKPCDAGVCPAENDSDRIAQSAALRLALRRGSAVNDCRALLCPIRLCPIRRAAELRSAQSG